MWRCKIRVIIKQGNGWERNANRKLLSELPYSKYIMSIKTHYLIQIKESHVFLFLFRIFHKLEFL